MKRFLLLIVLLFWSSVAFGAGSCTTPSVVGGKIQGEFTELFEASFVCTADSGDGSFPAVNVTGIAGALTGVYIDEGSTTTDGTITVSVKKYGTDINLVGANGTDINTSGGYATLKPINTVDSESYLADFIGGLTVQITANTTGSANPKVILTIRK